jgi:hypothetical protein
MIWLWFYHDHRDGRDLRARLSKRPTHSIFIEQRLGADAQLCRADKAAPRRWRAPRDAARGHGSGERDRLSDSRFSSWMHRELNGPMRISSILAHGSR